MVWSRETCPAAAPCMMALPLTVEPVRHDIEVLAIRVPFITLLVPRVMAEPATQNMFLACAPPASTTVLVLSVVMEVALRKIKAAFASPWASRYKMPPGDISMEVPDS